MLAEECVAAPSSRRLPLGGKAAVRPTGRHDDSKAATGAQVFGDSMGLHVIPRTVQNYGA